MSFKRKRPVAIHDYGVGRAGSQVYLPFRAPRPLKRRKAFVPGRDRVGGYYGRYSVGGRGELKFHDVDLDDAVIAGGGGVTDSINKIAQGVTESQRIGRKCTIKSINWKYRIAIPEIDAAASAEVADGVRVIMYIDKQCNGATAAVTDLLETASVHSFRNLANSGRFVFLLDKLYVMNYTTLASDGAGVVSSAEVTREYSFYKKCNLPIEFNSTTGVIAEIRSNNIGVLLIARNGDAGFLSKIRLRFSDN